MKKLLLMGALITATSYASGLLCAGGSTTTFTGGVTLDLTFANTCTIAGDTFSNFFVTAQNNSVPSSFGAQAVLLTGGTLSLSFTNLSLTPGADIQFGFQSTGSAPLSLVLGGGSATVVTEGVCLVAFVGESCLGTGNLVGGLTTVTNGGSATVTITSANGNLFFSKDITGGSGVTQTFSAVPEPASLSFMGLGILGLGFWKKIRK